VQHVDGARAERDRPAHRDRIDEARLVHGTERETWRKRVVEAWPDYSEYQEKTTTRVLPVFVLTPVDK
jgi:F420H(2)-dependent quinone reductase